MESKVLYGYFGAIGDHTAEWPGHPLYQLNFLDSMQHYFHNQSFDIVYFNPPIDYSFSALKDFRTRLAELLIDAEMFTTHGVAPKIDFLKYDAVVLKHRFQNKSRLADLHGLDCEVYESILRASLDNKKPTYIVDSDNEVLSDPYFLRRFNSTDLHIFTFFKFPPQYDVNTIRISPTSRILLSMIETQKPKADFYNFAFDGNNYLKDDKLAEYIRKLDARNYFSNLFMFGKGWNVGMNFTRADRKLFYNVRELSS
jgi:hypothetical protein